MAFFPYEKNATILLVYFTDVFFLMHFFPWALFYGRLFCVETGLNGENSNGIITNTSYSIIVFKDYF